MCFHSFLRQTKWRAVCAFTGKAFTIQFSHGSLAITEDFSHLYISRFCFSFLNLGGWAGNFINDDVACRWAHN